VEKFEKTHFDDWLKNFIATVARTNRQSIDIVTSMLPNSEIEMKSIERSNSTPLKVEGSTQPTSIEIKRSLEVVSSAF
jgi:hypothetical protein